jgi:hypothetical protein
VTRAAKPRAARTTKARVASEKVRTAPSDARAAAGRLQCLSPGRRVVRGFRMTLRRNPAKPPLVICNTPPLATDPPADPRPAEYPVRLTFLLTTVLPGNAVRIRCRETRHCSREFFAVVAWDRAVTCRATITRDDDPRTFGRHLTVVRGALVISGGMVEPQLFD